MEIRKIQAVIRKYPILLWILGCALSGGCASVPHARPLGPKEEAILNVLQETLRFEAQREKDARIGKVSRSLREALEEGRIQIFQGTPARPEVGGQVVGNRVYLRKEWFYNDRQELISISENLADEQELTRLFSLLYVYVHEGVHMTQSPWRRFFRLEQCEQEAYQVSHEFLNGLLRSKILDPERTSPLLARMDEGLFLKVHGRSHVLFDWKYLGPRCAEWTLDQFQKRRLDQARKTNRGFTLHREPPIVWRAPFVRVGPSRGRVRLPFPLPIEAVSRLGKPDEIDLAWVLIEPGGAEEVHRWNSGDGVKVERIGPTASGQWRIDLLVTATRKPFPRYVTIVGIPLYTWFEPNQGPEPVPAMPQASASDSKSESHSK